MTVDELQVGDRLYITKYGNLRSVETVTKITPTMIRSKNYNYRKRGDHLKVLGQSTWDQLGVRTESPELQKQWHEIQLRQWWSNNYNKVSLDDIERLKNSMEASQ